MKKILVIAVASALVSSVITLTIAYNVLKDQNNTLQVEKTHLKDSMETMFSAESTAHFYASKTRDSLYTVNSQLSKFRALTDAMVYRDSIRKPLRFNIGDIAYLKRDSSRVLVTDIVVGGGKFEHYIKYHVMFKDKSFEEVAPELLYDRN